MEKLELLEFIKELTIELEQHIKLENMYFTMLSSLLSEKYGDKRSYEILSKVIKEAKHGNLES